MPDSPEFSALPMASTSTATNVAGLSSMNKEKEKERGYSMLTRGRRPSPPPRQPSYSKRHASIDSPREVPLPSPSLHVQGGQVEYSYFDVPLKNPKSPRKQSQSSKEKEKDIFTPVFEEDFEGSEWTSVDKQPVPALSLSLQTKSQVQGILTPPHTGSSSHLYETHSPLGRLSGNSQQIHPYPRPYSLPHSSSSASGGSGSGGSVLSSTSSSDFGGEGTSAPRLARSRTEDGVPASTDIYSSDLGFGKGVDRSSSASLPLPAQIPFHILPKVGDSHKTDVGRLRELVSDVARSKVPESVAEDADDIQARPVDSTSDDSSTLLPRTSRSPSPSRGAIPSLLKSPPTFPPGAHGNPNMPSMLASHSHGPNPSHTSTVGPATFSKTAYSSDGSSDHLNSIIEATAHATALRHRPTSVRSNNSSSLPPPEPPTVLPPPSPTFVLSSPAPEPNPLAEAPPQPIPQPPPVPPITDPSELPPVLPPSRPRRSVPSDFLTSSVGAGPSHTSSSGSILSFPGASGLGSSSSSAPGALGQSANRGSSPNPPAYAPFLSHMPPPADSWIEVETTPAEYRLNIRLPGFKRDGITLATKRRRILHVVADSWPDPDPSPRGGNSTEPSTPSRGGHFERRISFGYDADLVGVRAEFDGEILKIVVPRRQELGWNRPFD